MPSESNFNRLVARVYELGLEAGQWPQMLDEIAAFYGCDRIAYIHFAESDAWRSLNIFRHPEPDAPKVLNSLQTFAEMPAGSDVWYAAVNRPRFRRKSVLIGHEVLDVGDLLRSDHYNQVVRPTGGFDALMMRVEQDGAYSSFISMYTHGAERVFSRRDADFHRALQPHVARIVGLQSKFRHELRMASLGEAAFNALDIAIVIVEANGKIVFANRAAQALLRSTDGVEERRGRLTVRDGEAAGRLAAAIRRACGAGFDALPIGGGLAVARTPPKAALGAQVLPLEPAGSVAPYRRFAFERVALIIFSDPDAKRPTDRELLATVFDLTHQEARIAELLLAGLTQKEIGEALGLVEGTVRWHVKNLLSKTGTRRESQLVRKLALVPPPMDMNKKCGA